MDPFTLRLQQLTYRDRTLRVEAAAAGMGITRQTLSAWINERWKVPLDGARNLVAYTKDLTLSRALVVGTGLRVVPQPSREQPQSLFVLIGAHMSLYERLFQIAVKMTQGTATHKEREEARELLNQFRDFTDQIEAEIDRQEQQQPTD